MIYLSLKALTSQVGIKMDGDLVEDMSVIGIWVVVSVKSGAHKRRRM